MNNNLFTLLEWDPNVQALIIGKLEIIWVDICDQILQSIVNQRLVYSCTMKQQQPKQVSERLKSHWKVIW